MKRNDENIDQIFYDVLMNFSVEPLNYAWEDLIERLSKNTNKESVQKLKPHNHEKDYLNTCNNWPGLAY